MAKGVKPDAPVQPDYDQNNPAENAEPKEVVMPEAVTTIALDNNHQGKLSIVNHDDGRTHVVMA